MASAAATFPSLRLAAAPRPSPKPRFPSLFFGSTKCSSCIFASAEEVNIKKCILTQAVGPSCKAPVCAAHGIVQHLTSPYILQPAPANALEQIRNMPQTELKNNLQLLFLANIDPATTKILIGTTGPFLSAFGFLFIVRIVMSWYPKLPVGKFPYVIAYAPTEPILRVTRRLIPPVGGVDVTPVVWFGLLSFLNEILVGPQGLLVLLSQQV